MLFDIRFLQSLRYVDDEVSHLLQLVDDVHVVDAGLVALPVALKSLDLMRFIP